MKILLIMSILLTVAAAKADDDTDAQIARQNALIERQQEMLEAQQRSLNYHQMGNAFSNLANQLSRPSTPQTNCVSYPNVFGGYNVRCN